jgi:hypothetical protein
MFKSLNTLDTCQRSMGSQVRTGVRGNANLGVQPRGAMRCGGGAIATETRLPSHSR